MQLVPLHHGLPSEGETLELGLVAAVVTGACMWSFSAAFPDELKGAQTNKETGRQIRQFQIAKTFVVVT